MIGSEGPSRRRFVHGNGRDVDELMCRCGGWEEEGEIGNHRSARKFLTSEDRRRMRRSKKTIRSEDLLVGSERHSRGRMRRSARYPHPLESNKARLDRKAVSRRLRRLCVVYTIHLRKPNDQKK